MGGVGCEAQDGMRRIGMKEIPFGMVMLKHSLIPLIEKQVIELIEKLVIELIEKQVIELIEKQVIELIEKQVIEREKCIAEVVEVFARLAAQIVHLLLH